MLEYIKIVLKLHGQYTSLISPTHTKPLVNYEEKHVINTANTVISLYDLHTYLLTCEYIAIIIRKFINRMRWKCDEHLIIVTVAFDSVRDQVA